MGHRQFADLGPLTCELGGSLPSVRVAYETWGQLAPDSSNAILILHALTGDSHVVGPADAGHPTAGWWQDSIGPGAALDTDRWFVVAPNVLGGCQGSTGPSSLHPDGRAYGSRFPRVTVADQVEVEARLADLLGIHQWAAVIGGSMGAMRALEWLVGRPERVARGLVVAVGACATGDQIGTQTTQIRAITDDPHYNGGDYYDAAPGDGPHTGLMLARAIGQIGLRLGRRLGFGEIGPHGAAGQQRRQRGAGQDITAAHVACASADASASTRFTWRRENSPIAAGRTVRNSSGASRVPPTTTMASGRWTWLPIALENAAGSRPTQAAAQVTGVVLTKLDGTARGGIVVAIERVLRIPVKFVGVGEGAADLRTFDPDEFVASLLGA